MAVLETERNSIVKFAKDVSTDGYGPSEIPYWLVNVPSAEWPSECPTFLQNISQKDREIIGTPDSDYHRLSWPEVRKVVGTLAPSCSLVNSRALQRLRDAIQGPAFAEKMALFHRQGVGAG